MKLHKKGLAASGIAFAIFLLFLLLFFAGEWAVASLTEDLDALSGGERWSAKDEPYATIALHTDTESAMSRNQVESYALSIDRGLLEASMTAEGSGSVWTYGYFTESVLSVKGPKSTASLQTMAVGGSFFTFHPLKFLYGAPFAYDKSLPYGVVLDEDAAWRVFGAIDVVGMTVEIGGKEFTVTGITAHERDTEGYTRAYGEIPRIYMSYYGYEIVAGDAENNITTIEYAIPNPVDGFARGIFDTAVKINEDTMVLRENFQRYDLLERFRRMGELPYMGMRNDRIVYPYFENELQVIDYTASLWMIAQVIAAAVAILALLTSIIGVFLSGFSFGALGKMAWHKWEDVFDGYMTKQRKKRHAKRKKKRTRPNPIEN